MPEEPSPYEEIRQRVEKRFQRRKSFVTDIGMMVLISGGIWLVWLSTDPSARIPALWPLLISGGLLLAGFDQIVGLIMGELENRAVQREIEREREYQLGLMEKVKRDDSPALRLSDDGELVESEDNGMVNRRRKSR